MKKYIFLLTLFSGIVLTGCNSSNENVKSTDAIQETTVRENTTTEASTEIAKTWIIEEEPKIVSTGKINDQKWAVLQFENLSEPKIENEGAEMTRHEVSEPILGVSYAVTYNRKWFYEESLEDPSKSSQGIENFQLSIYEIGKEGKPKTLDLMEFKELQENADYTIDSFTKEDKYLAIEKRNIEDSGVSYLYLDMKSMKLLTEKEIDAADRFESPLLSDYLFFVEDEATEKRLIKKFPRLDNFWSAETETWINFSKDTAAIEPFLNS